MKRFAALMIILTLILPMTGCQTASALFQRDSAPEGSTQANVVQEEDIKIGFLFSLGSDAPDTISHTAAIRKMQRETGLKDSQIMIVTNVGADQYADKIEKLISQGCDLIFAKASTAEPAMIEAARNHPEVEFCQEDGSKMKASGLTNCHSYYVRLYEGYYVAGIVAGHQLNLLLNQGKITGESCVVGFAALRKNPENISCANAFYLGIKEVCSQASMIVRYADSSGNFDKDDECARQLIAAGARLMGQRVFTTAVASACAEYNTPLVGNEINLIDVAPKQALTSVVADWSIYYTHAVKCLVAGKDIEPDWTAGYEENAVCLSQFNDAHMPDGAIDQVIDVEKELRTGKYKVFDTKTFTVEGEILENLIKTNADYKKYKPYVVKGEFRESVKKSTPVIRFLVDGITVSTENFLPEVEDTSQEGSTTEEEN